MYEKENYSSCYSYYSYDDSGPGFFILLSKLGDNHVKHGHKPTSFWPRPHLLWPCLFSRWSPIG